MLYIEFCLYRFYSGVYKVCCVLHGSYVLRVCFICFIRVLYVLCRFYVGVMLVFLGFYGFHIGDRQVFICQGLIDTEKPEVPKL